MSKAPQFNLQDIKTGEVFGIVFPEAFGDDTLYPVFILGVTHMDDGNVHYRVVLFNYKPLPGFVSLEPFSIILKSDDEKSIRNVFKQHLKAWWKSVLDYELTKVGYNLGFIFDFNKSFTQYEKFMGIHSFIKELIASNHNAIGPVISELIRPIELERDKEYVMEEYFGDKIGSLYIIKIIDIETAGNTNKTTIKYSDPTVPKWAEPKSVIHTIVLDSHGKNSTNAKKTYYFYKRPTIEEGMKKINLSDDRKRLLALRKSYGRNNSGGVARPPEFPRAQGPGKWPNVLPKNKVPKTGGKRKTRRQRRMAKKSRKQRKN